MTYSFLEGQKYQCIACGRCCQNWEIHVSKEEEKKLLQRDWKSLAPRISGVEAVVGDGLLLFKENKCIFLEPDLKCLIQAKCSYDEKPLSCRQFPIWVTETPEGKRITPSFFCLAVLRNQGVHLKENPELSPEAIAKFAISPVKLPINLLGQASVDWNEFRKYESEFFSILDKKDLDLQRQIIAIYHRGHEIARAKVNNREIKPLEESVSAALKETHVSEPTKARFIRAIFLVFIEEATLEKGKQSGSSFAFSFVWQTLKMALEWGSIRISALGHEFPVIEVDKVPFDWKDPQLTELLNRYLKNLVFRGQVLTEQGVFRGVSTMMIAFSLVVWYSRFSALANKRPKVSLEDLETGVSLVEKLFIQHTKGVQKLVSEGLFSILLEILMARQPVATSLVLF